MIKDFNENEKIALAGILKWIVSSDNQDSLQGIENFFKENKWGSFQDIFEKADSKFETIDELKSFLPTINNKESQDIIIQVARDIITSDVIVTSEEKHVLNFLSEIWK